MREERKEAVRDLAWTVALGVPVGALVIWLLRADTWWSPLALGGLGGFILGAPAVAGGLAWQYDDWEGPRTTRQKVADTLLFVFTFLLVPTWMVAKTDFFVVHAWPQSFDVSMRALASLPFAAFFVASLKLRAKPNEKIPQTLRTSLHALWLGIQAIGTIAPWVANPWKLTLAIVAGVQLLPILAIGWWVNARRAPNTSK